MTGPWLRPTKAAAYVDMPYKSFAAWVKEKGVPFGRIGRNRRFSQPVLDNVLRVLSLRKESERPQMSQRVSSSKSSSQLSNPSAPSLPLSLKRG